MIHVGDGVLGSRSPTRSPVLATRVFFFRSVTLINPGLLLARKYASSFAIPRTGTVHARARALVEKEEKRFHVFVNEHFRATYIDNKEGETANDRVSCGSIPCFVSMRDARSPASACATVYITVTW